MHKRPEELECRAVGGVQSADPVIVDAVVHESGLHPRPASHQRGAVRRPSRHQAAQPPERGNGLLSLERAQPRQLGDLGLRLVEPQEGREPGDDGEQSSLRRGAVRLEDPPCVFTAWTARCLDARKICAHRVKPGIILVSARSIPSGAAVADRRAMLAAIASRSPVVQGAPGCRPSIARSTSAAPASVSIVASTDGPRGGASIETARISLRRKCRESACQSAPHALTNARPEVVTTTPAYEALKPPCAGESETKRPPIAPTTDARMTDGTDAHRGRRRSAPEVMIARASSVVGGFERTYQRSTGPTTRVQPHGGGMVR